MEEITPRSYNLQCLWALLEGTKCIQAHELEALTPHCQLIGTTITRAEKFASKNRDGHSRCYLCGC
jgi:hypothetical protein